MKSKIVSKRRPVAARSHLPVVHRLHALLQTLRVIEQHEEQICTLVHLLEKTGQMEEAVGRELQAVLEELPSRALQAELDGILAALEQANASAVTIP